MEKVEEPPMVPVDVPTPPPYPGPPVVNPPVDVYSGYPVQPAVQLGTAMVVVQQHLTDAPGQMMCPYCQTTVITKTTHKNGLLTWLLCGTIALICWPCFWIPFIVDDCKNVEHSCPTCNSVLHIYKRC